MKTKKWIVWALCVLMIVSLLPACISLGAVFMMLVDTAARSLSAGVIPLSVLTAIFGAPFFIVLMRRSGGWQL